MLTMPAGKPASLMSAAKRSAVSGVTSDGLSTMVLPVASAGAILLATMSTALDVRSGRSGEHSRELTREVPWYDLALNFVSIDRANNRSGCAHYDTYWFASRVSQE